MTEFKTIQKAEKSLTIAIPSELQGKELEIIIKEIDGEAEKRKKIQEILLNGPTWTDEQYQAYLTNRKYLGKWEQI
ncbi:MAG: hypothetical protein MUE85_05345 [Microscillaceae bacterium]|jgi:hypothetical protein|nr:hypothetical protein [Microscillaceae bacterium]